MDELNLPAIKHMKADVGRGEEDQEGGREGTRTNTEGKERDPSR